MMMKPPIAAVFASILASAIGLVCFSESIFAQTRGNPYTPPRTADGKPSLEGIWQARNSAAWGLESHPGDAGIQAGRSVIIDPPDGMIPYLPSAAAKRKENYRNRVSADPLAKCYMPGVPRVMYLPFPLQIFQTPKYIAILSEFANSYRVIHMGSDHPNYGVNFWMGDSRGHWEGDTLVVDVRSNIGDTWLDAVGDFHSSALHVVERYTRTESDVITYEAMIEDPAVYTRPWKIRMPLYLNREKNAQLLEYVCYAYTDDLGEGK